MWNLLHFKKKKRLNYFCRHACPCPTLWNGYLKRVCLFCHRGKKLAPVFCSPLSLLLFAVPHTLHIPGAAAWQATGLAEEMNVFHLLWCHRNSHGGCCPHPLSPPAHLGLLPLFYLFIYCRTDAFSSRTLLLYLFAGSVCDYSKPTRLSGRGKDPREAIKFLLAQHFGATECVPCVMSLSQLLPIEACLTGSPCLQCPVAP